LSYLDLYIIYEIFIGFRLSAGLQYNPLGVTHSTKIVN